MATPERTSTYTSREAMNQVDCCIVGGGPAGMMLSLFLARRGVSVQLLEMHKDFDRDFRGDTVHASTLNVLDELGLADGLLELPHSKLTQMRIVTPERVITPANFSALGGKFPYIAIMPQVEFLNYILQAVDNYPSFNCTLGSVVVGTITNEQGHTLGVRCKTESGEHEVRAKVVVAADGRFSKLRKLSGLPSQRRAPPMDVCWFRVPYASQDPDSNGAFYIAQGKMLVCIPRTDEWQLGFVFPKGDFQTIRAKGIEAFRADLLATAPWLGSRAADITSFKQLHLLRIESDCLTTWHKPGLLMIGDAAHVMSPVGGVGINAAIADAVAAANHLGPALLAGHSDDQRLQPDGHTLPHSTDQGHTLYEGHTLNEGHTLSSHHLAAVQKSRMLVTRIIQTAQAAIQSNIVALALRDEPFDLPFLAKVITRTPGLRNIPVRLFATGVRQPKLTF